jgi:hypothetical protein
MKKHFAPDYCGAWSPLDLRRLSTLVPSPAPTASVVPDVSGLVGTALVKKSGGWPFE